MRPNPWTLTAGGLLAATALLHLVAGETDVHRPLRALTGAGEMGLYASVLWHGISVLLLTSAAGLLMAGTGAGRDRWRGAAILATAQTAGLGALFLIYGGLLAGSVWIAPQWALLLPVAGLAAIGLTGARR